MSSLIYMGGGMLVLLIVAIVVALFVASRFVRGRSDALLVVTGYMGKNPDGDNKVAKIVHGGLTFVWPFIQTYSWLTLEPFKVKINLEGALSKENIRVNIPCEFTLAVNSTNVAVTENACIRLLDIIDEPRELEGFVSTIVFGQMRGVIANLKIEEINNDRLALQNNIIESVEKELAKVGLTVVNVNITDIRDEAQYLENLGRKAEAEARAKASVDIAEQEKVGAVGAARESTIRRQETAQLEYQAVAKENEAKALTAHSTAQMQRDSDIARATHASEAAIAVAEATKQAKLAEAEADKVILTAQQETEGARQARDTAAAFAAQVPAIEAEKKIAILRGEAQGEAKKAEMLAQAEGVRALMSAQAEGIAQIVKAAGGDAMAAILIMSQEQVPGMFKTACEAIAQRKIDKMVVVSNADGDKGGSALHGLTTDLLNMVPQVTEELDTLGVTGPKSKQDEAPVDPR